MTGVHWMNEFLPPELCPWRGAVQDCRSRTEPLVSILHNSVLPAPSVPCPETIAGIPGEAWMSKCNIDLHIMKEPRYSFGFRAFKRNLQLSVIHTSKSISTFPRSTAVRTAKNNPCSRRRTSDLDWSMGLAKDFLKFLDKEAEPCKRIMAMISVNISEVDPLG